MARMFGWLVLLSEATRTRTDTGHAEACSRNPVAARPRRRYHCPDRARAGSRRS